MIRLLVILMLFTSPVSAQFNCGFSVGAETGNTALHIFKKQNYGLLALTQEVGGNLTMTNVFFDGANGLALTISTDTTGAIGYVHNFKVKDHVLQTYCHYSTANIWNVGLRSDIKVGKKFTLLNFTGYKQGVYSRFGVLYNFD